MKNKAILFFLVVVLFGFSGYGQTVIDTTAEMHTPEKFPEYRTGINGWVTFLERNLNRDLPYKEGAPAGKYQVVVSFLVDTLGRVSDIILEKDPGYGAGKEVKRIIRLSDKRWIPAYDKGQPVLFRHTQSITFVVN